jgi:hypothetical protein
MHHFPEVPYYCALLGEPVVVPSGGLQGLEVKLWITTDEQLQLRGPEKLLSKMWQGKLVRGADATKALMHLQCVSTTDTQKAQGKWLELRLNPFLQEILSVQIYVLWQRPNQSQCTKNVSEEGAVSSWQKNVQ